MKDKIAWLAELIIGFGIGYGMTVAIGYYRTRSITPQHWRRLWDFIREHGRIHLCSRRSRFQLLLWAA
jgi:hypothetical protein